MDQKERSQDSLTSFPLLLSPFSLRNLILNNRLCMAATLTGLGAQEGEVTQKLLDFLTERARGEAGLIVVEGTYPHRGGKAYVRQLGIDHDRFIPGFSRLTENIHRFGSKVFLQLLHGGRYCSKEALGERSPVAPSAIPPRIPRPFPKELSIPEIEEIVISFGIASKRAKEAGFDGVEIVANTGYLISSFLSPLSNQRKDSYGGDYEGRSRILLEVIRSIRSYIGEDLPVMVRMNACELMEGGNSPSDLREIAKIVAMEDIDAISLTVGWHESQISSVTMNVPMGSWAYLAGEMKQVVNRPVMMAYGIHTPLLAEELLEKGMMDLVVMSRPLIADPHLMLKVREKRTEDIIPCISCCHGCFGNLFEGRSISCSVNPLTGREGEIYKRELEEPKRKRKVIVIGGGLAGLEAAITSAELGDETILLEKEKDLGGQVRIASLPPGRERINLLTEYILRRVGKSKVTIEMEKEATIPLIKRYNPDLVILATGARPLFPEGIDKNLGNIYTYEEVLKDVVDTGEAVVVLGGGLVGVEVAEFLSLKGKKVKVIEETGRLALDATPFERQGMIKRLKELGVEVITNSRAEVTGEGKIIIISDKGKEELEADSIVIALGLTPNDELLEPLKASGIEVRVAGDAVAPRKILDAITEGFLAAIS